MISSSRFSFPLWILSAVAIQFAFTASAQDNLLQSSSDDGKTPVPIEKKEEQQPEQQNWAIHFDAIEVLQGQPEFHAPYSGTNSLHPGDNFRQTSQADIFINVHLWPGGEFYFNPEYYQGFGLGITHGLAQFPNSMAYKTGQYRGDVNIPHLFLRQTIGFGGRARAIACRRTAAGGESGHISTDPPGRVKERQPNLREEC